MVNVSEASSWISRNACIINALFKSFEQDERDYKDRQDLIARVGWNRKNLFKAEWVRVVSINFLKNPIIYDNIC